MKLASRILKIVLITLSCIVFFMSIRFIVEKKQWSPIDEYAHMDYIEKLGEGMMPKLHYAISNDIYSDLIEHPTRSFTGLPVHNREELGLGNYSYQAKHPPIYYATLLIPNMIMKKIGIKTYERLTILRIISFLLYALGICICIPIFKMLRFLGFQIPEFYSWLCVLFCLLIATHQRYGLTNNMLSPLFINASLLYLLKYNVSHEIKYLYGFMLLAGLSVCVALTNVFIIPFLFLYALIIYWPQFNLKTFLIACSILLIPATVIVWWKIFTIPDKAFENYIQNLLLVIIPCNVLTFKMFLDLLLNDTFQLSFININYNLTDLYLILLIINILLFLVFIKTIIKKHLWLAFAMVIFVIFVCNLYFLNAYVPRVHWVALRNYMGFVPLLFISCSGFIVVISGKIKQKIA